MFFFGDEFRIGDSLKDVWWLSARMNELHIVECFFYPRVLRVLDDVLCCFKYVAAFKVAVVGRDEWNGDFLGWW